MKIAHIVPPDYLTLLYAVNTGYHFVLGQEAIVNTQYREFYRTLARRGHFIIVDNGAAELHSGDVQEIPAFRDIVDVADYIGADEIILPDKLRDMYATLEMFAKAVNDHMVAPRRCMAVPQGETLNEWIDCLRLMSVGSFATIGIPKHMARMPGSRILLANHLRYRTENIHMLGVWGEPVTEVSELAMMTPWVRGLDTGAAMAWAQNNEPIHIPSGVRYSLDWNGRSGLTLAANNMEALNAAAAGLPIGGAERFLPQAPLRQV